MGRDNIEIIGAKEHNLKNISVSIPRHSLTVITGLSGSGKSSLAFDTIYAEGQRRYIDTFGAYARNFLGGGMERPNVEEIKGLSPVISIEQKTTNKNPRSTVGTVTEIYDFLRLLYARAGEAISYISGEKMSRYGDDTIIDMVLNDYNGRKVLILAPIIRHRKGHYQELFEKLRKKGYVSVRIDGEDMDIVYNMKLNRYQTHSIEVVIDKLTISEDNRERITRSLKQALREGDDVLMIMDYETKDIKYFSRNLMDAKSGLSYSEAAPNNFSFNSPIGQCPRCKGLGHLNICDIDKMFPNRDLSFKESLAIKKIVNKKVFGEIDNISKEFGLSINSPVKDFPKELLDEILYGNEEYVDVGSYFSHAHFISIEHFLKQYMLFVDDKSELDELNKFFTLSLCPECNGARLNKEALSYYIDGKNISEVSSMQISDFYNWVSDLDSKLSETQKKIATEILKEIRSRSKFLLDVGLSYLSINRNSGSLSGGESQRIRLATQIGSQLVEVLYILDEPSIGLHQRDNIRLINSLKTLRDVGNTVIVVEHDNDMILSADHIIDIGPKAGRFGGNVVFEGSPDEMMKAGTITAQYISGVKNIDAPKQRREGNGNFISIRGAKGNNLKSIDVDFPLGTMIAVAGVSGSGKSTLINRTLYPAISKKLYSSLEEPMPYDEIIGIENIDKIISVDQQPIGRTPRSNPATYIGVFSEIRNLFASLPESKARAYKPGRFSFNVAVGRCTECSGNGYRTIEMNFLPDVYVPCEVCAGKRYNRETLEVRYKGKSIADILDMTINQAVEFFENIPTILRKIKVLQDVGLGYIKLGQSSTTLSGGESQRIKLASELSKRDTGRTLYVLDEPTTGLHFEDINVLMETIHKLVDKGNTVIIIEHNIDVLKSCDYIIEIGPEGGAEGGQLIYQGSLDKIVDIKNSPTAPFLIGKV